MVTCWLTASLENLELSGYFIDICLRKVTELTKTHGNVSNDVKWGSR